MGSFEMCIRDRTCTFHMRSMRIRCYYYRDESLADLAGSYSYAGNYDYYSDERVSLNAFRKDDLQDKDTMYNSCLLYTSTILNY